MSYSPNVWLPFLRKCRLRILFTFVLAFSVVLIFKTSGREVAGQTSCQVNCNAVVPDTAATGSSVSFAATATANGCASSVSYEWDFGDGSPHAGDANTTHAYAAPGVYNWRLTTRANNGVTTIDTIAGGYGEGLEVNRAAFTSPTAIARDPLGRGLYIFDQTAREGLLRFINTSTASVMRAGKVIAPGTSRVLMDTSDAGDFLSLNFALVAGMVASTDGNVLFIADASNSTIIAFNVSDAPQTVLGNSVPSRRLLQIGLAPEPGLGGLAIHPQTGQLHFATRTRIYKLAALNQATAVAGNGNTATRFYQIPPFVALPALQEELFAPRGLARRRKLVRRSVTAKPVRF